MPTGDVVETAEEAIDRARLRGEEPCVAEKQSVRLSDALCR
jgi:hypothetical protein